MAITGTTAANLTPAPVKKALASNYMDFAGGTNGWADQYLPEVMAAEAEAYGNRTMSGFLAQVGAEESMTSDQVIWSEQGRLHLAYKGHVEHAANVATDYGAGTATNVGGQLEIEQDIDGRAITTTHGIRKNDILLIADSDSTAVVIVTSDPVGAEVFDVALYDSDNSALTLTAAGFSAGSDGDTTLTILVIGSEYKKGDNGRTGQNEPDHKTYFNKPIILKDKYAVSGSDASQIGWVEVSGEDGTGGYLWYVKAEAETRMRFMDYLEMSMIETVLNDASEGGADHFLGVASGTTTDNIAGHQGLFQAIEDRGNQSSGITGVNCATDLAEFDAILAELDKNGAIEENMLFVNRTTALAIDDMLACMNSYGAGGTSYGVFNNSEDMALNLGFSGFRRGSYDFYKSDWKYLNQKDGRGGINDTNTVGAIRGVMIPAGVSSVYDQMLGKNMKRPFLHVRYRASETDNRRLKTWVTGSVGAVTSDLDAMEVHYLSERCLITQGANNFFLLN
jgi:hypothetical protein